MKDISLIIKENFLALLGIVFCARLLKKILNRIYPILKKYPTRLSDNQDIQACFSPGVDQISDVEWDCANRGMQVFMADYSVEGSAATLQNFHFLKKFPGIIQTENTITPTI